MDTNNGHSAELPVHERDQDFMRLAMDARLEHGDLRMAAREDSPAHRAAMDYVRAQGWPWAEKLLKASLLDWAGNPQRAIQLLHECESDVPDQYRCLLDFFKGSALQSVGDNDGAATAYKEVTQAAISPLSAYAWSNLGVVLHDKGDHDNALDALHRSLQDKHLDQPGHVWSNIGIVLKAQGKYDEAIAAYREALKDPNYPFPNDIWNNLGNALISAGKREDALEAYRNALDSEDYSHAATTWANIGQLWSDSDDTDQARDAFEKALACPDTRGVDHARARLGLQLLGSATKPEALSPSDRALHQRDVHDYGVAELENEIIAKIREAGDSQYDKYIRNREDSKRTDVLSILRGWSSAVTLLEGSERRWRGGGYFLKWRGCGIVIDPGFDFLHNFHDAGYHGREIDCVIVSHCHPDHNSELKDIDDLKYELHKRLVATDTNGSHSFVLLWDQDTYMATKFDIEEPQHRHDPIVMSHGYQQEIDLHRYDKPIPIRVIPFKVAHGDNVRNAMGIVVELLDEDGQTALRLGYTADTEYFQDLHGHLADCDILIAHISQPSIEELADPSKLKQVHLGYRGTVRLLRECNPKLALVGEFWAGFADLRISLTKGLRQRSGLDSVFPAGIGMHVRIPSMEIECTQCGVPTHFSRVKVSPPADTFGNLAYLCPNCFLE